MKPIPRDINGNPLFTYQNPLMGVDRYYYNGQLWAVADTLHALAEKWIQRRRGGKVYPVRRARNRHVGNR